MANGNGDSKIETKSEEKTTALTCVDTGPLSIYFDSATFQQGWRAAQLLSSTALVPQRYTGKPADCFVALALARRLGLEPFTVLPDLYVVHGTPAMSGKLVIAMINGSGLYKGSLKFRMDEATPPAWCEAYAVERETGDEVKVRISWDDVRSNGWDRDGSKWRSMRAQMFRYRSAAWFARAYCPQVVFGLLTVDEVEDDLGPAARPAPVVVTVDPASPTARMDAAAALLAKRAEEMDAAKKQEHPAGPEHEPKSASEPAPETAPAQADLEQVAKRKRRGAVVDKTARLEGEELTRLVHAVETANVLGDAQTVDDYIEGVLDRRVPLADLTRQQADRVLASLDEKG